MDIKNVLAERTMVEYYTDGSLRPSIPTSRDKQYPNLVYIKMGATFCVNDKPALSAQANLSLWSSSTHSELVAIFLALLTNPMNVKIKIYTDSQSAIYMINNKHNKSGRKLLKQSNSLILLKINILLQEKKMKLVLVKVKGHRRDVMNEMANKDLWSIIKRRIQNNVIPIIQKWSNSTENTPKIINKKLNQILEIQHDNNKFIDFCLLALEAKQLKQNKQQSKKNNMTNSQEDQMEFGDTSLELDSVQPENLKNENLILSKCYKMRKKAQDQMCLLINNNWWFSWAYKKTKNVVNNVIIDLAIV
ncbi:hypothetical protein RhiirB3_437113 [Rhizophagus irregularis]|nr:hypothetical protein RhiirB3_437113 [Rhizophagus irregularis]